MAAPKAASPCLEIGRVVSRTDDMATIDDQEITIEFIAS